MEKKVWVLLTRSMIGRPQKHRKILRSMGLNKINSKAEFYDSPSIRGKIEKVKHLIRVGDVE